MKFSRILVRAGAGLASVVLGAGAITAAGPSRGRVQAPGASSIAEIERAPAVVTAAATAGTGAIAVVDASGAAVSGNVFTSRDQVYLTGGPFDAACTIGALPDGSYFYQVTDASGQTQLTGAARSLAVSGGVIVSADGAAAAAPTACGSEIVSLVPFDRAPKGIGNYRVWITPAADFQSSSCGSGCYFGFLPAFSTTQTFAVREDARCQTTHCLSGVVFSDANQNGQQDAGEPGLPGVVIAATDGRGISATAVSGPDGTWSICGLPETQYTVSETPPAGYQQTAPSQTLQISRYLASVSSNGVGSFTVTFCNENFTNLAFGNFALPGSISGTKFNDANGNGLLDSGESGVAGVTINLFSGATPSGAPLATATTDSAGGFSFPNLTAGTYSLTETLPAGYVQTTPGGSGALVLSLAPGQTLTDALFGNQLATATITGTKFDDTNGNAMRDSGEAGIEGVTIILTNASGSSIQTTTDAAGNFSFPNQPPGTYVVSEIVPAGYHQTFPGAPGTMTVTLASGQTVSVLFGNQAIAAGTISGFVFYDVNKDRIQDNGEKPFPDVTIRLEDTSGNIVTTTVTDANGNFTFTGIAPGDYLVTPVPPVNFFQTVPPDKAPIAVHLEPGGTVSHLVFGLSC